MMVAALRTGLVLARQHGNLGRGPQLLESWGLAHQHTEAPAVAVTAGPPGPRHRHGAHRQPRRRVLVAVMAGVTRPERQPAHLTRRRLEPALRLLGPAP
jgi:hypothetical protein